MAAVDVFSHLGETTVLSGANSVTAPAAGTPETWTVADSSAFPVPQLNASQFQVVDVASPTEIIDVLQVVGNTWTVKRGAANTQPVPHAANFTVRNTIVYAALMRLLSAVGGGGDIVVNLGDIGGHVDADVSQGNYFKCRLVGNADISFINVLNDSKNREWQLETQQDTAGNHTLHINGVTQYDQRTAFTVTATANARDKFAFSTDNYPARLWAAQTYKDAGNLDFDSVLLGKNPLYFLKGESTGTPTTEVDNTANGHNGTWNGTPTYQQPANIPSVPSAHGVTLSGDDYMIVDSPICSLTGKWSLAFITNAPAPAAGAGLSIYSDGSTGSNTPTLFIQSGVSSGGKMRVFLRSDQNHVWLDETTGNVVFDGTNKVVVISYDGTGATPVLKIYVHSATAETVTKNVETWTAGDTITTTMSTWGATRRIAVGNQFAGLLSRMAAWNGTALTASDVQDLLTAYTGA